MNRHTNPPTQLYFLYFITATYFWLSLMMIGQEKSLFLVKVIWTYAINAPPVGTSFHLPFWLNLVLMKNIMNALDKDSYGLKLLKPRRERES
jgi:hypothetical protein